MNESHPFRQQVAQVIIDKFPPGTVFKVDDIGRAMSFDRIQDEFKFWKISNALKPIRKSGIIIPAGNTRTYCVADANRLAKVAKTGEVPLRAVADPHKVVQRTTAKTEDGNIGRNQVAAAYKEAVERFGRRAEEALFKVACVRQVWQMRAEHRRPLLAALAELRDGKTIEDVKKVVVDAASKLTVPVLIDILKTTAGVQKAGQVPADKFDDVIDAINKELRRCDELGYEYQYQNEPIRFASSKAPPAAAQDVAHLAQAIIGLERAIDGLKVDSKNDYAAMERWKQVLTAAHETRLKVLKDYYDARLQGVEARLAYLESELGVQPAERLTR